MRHRHQPHLFPLHGQQAQEAQRVRLHQGQAQEAQPRRQRVLEEQEEHSVSPAVSARQLCRRLCVARRRDALPSRHPFASRRHPRGRARLRRFGRTLLHRDDGERERWSRNQGWARVVDRPHRLRDY